jgi:hypothetical protein
VLINYLCDVFLPHIQDLVYFDPSIEIWKGREGKGKEAREREREREEGGKERERKREREREEGGKERERKREREREEGGKEGKGNERERGGVNEVETAEKGKFDPGCRQ